MTFQNSDVGEPVGTPDWLVYRVSGLKAKLLLGTVTAPTPETAEVAAFKEFNVTPAGRKHIIVQRVVQDPQVNE